MPYENLNDDNNEKMLDVIIIYNILILNIKKYN